MSKENILGLRILAFFIDFFVICLLQIVTIAVVGIDRLNNDVYLTLAVISAVTIVYFCKDIIGGRSIGKRIVGIKVYSIENRFLYLKYIVRNLFLMLWFVEILVVLLNPQRRRIGDILTGTYVDGVSK